MSASRQRGIRLAAAVTVGLGAAAVAGTAAVAYGVHASHESSTVNNSSTTTVTTDTGPSQVTSGGS
jgi:hypothetical protein